MPDGKRLWRTIEGDLVEDGHQDAVLLAYGEDDDLSEEDAMKVRSQAKQASVPADKQAPKGSDKQGAKPRNKRAPAAKKAAAPSRDDASSEVL